MLRVLIIGVFLLPACEKNISTERPPHKVTFLALGDSYTQGTNLNPEESWPYQLAQHLRNRNINVQDPNVIAGVGWATKELINGIQSRTEGLNYEMISICIGVNNQFFQYGLENYRGDIALILDRALELTSGRSDNVFVLSIPDYTVTPFAQTFDTALIASELLAYNRIKKEECEKRNIFFIDIRKLSREVENRPELLLENGLQLSAKSYKRWAEYLGPIVANWYY